MSQFDEVKWTAELAVDLHNRLHTRILTSGSGGPVVAALRTVVDLHGPDVIAEGTMTTLCSSCVDPFDAGDDRYPCKETRAIAVALGAPATDGVPPPLTGRAAWRMSAPRRTRSPGRD